jgi:hypothetical protein
MPSVASGVAAVLSDWTIPVRRMVRDEAHSVGLADAVRGRGPDQALRTITPDPDCPSWTG